MRKLKLMTVIGTRPEIIRLSETIRACDRAFDHVLVHTGQNYDYSLNQVFFDDLGLRAPDHYLSVVGANLGETMGNIIAKSYALMSELRPDAMLVLGDTNSALCAIPAKRLKIPIFHMEAGNRCFDQNVPEEINRKIVDHIADVNLAYTEHSRRYLMSEGYQRDRVYVTGSPMAEVIFANRQKIEASEVLRKHDLKPSGYFVLSAHREENVDREDKFREICSAVNSVVEEYSRPIVFSVHPRTKKRIDAAGIQLNTMVRMVEPLAFSDYCALQKNAYCVISDSGTLSEESAMLRFAAVLLRDSTERPEAVDAGTIVIGGWKAESLLRSIDLAISSFDAGLPLPEEYSTVSVSNTVTRIIQGWTGIVNRFTWMKGST
jgi:UDP-N-acetylglucosamine 2-epimerase (non-hydrolysing)